jgi:hypothetical protein
MNTKQGRSAEGKSKDSYSRSKTIPEIEGSLHSTEARKPSSKEPPFPVREKLELEQMEPEEGKHLTETSERPGLIAPVPSILAVVPPPLDEPQDGLSTVQNDTTGDDGDSVVELPNFYIYKQVLKNPSDIYYSDVRLSS